MPPVATSFGVMPKVGAKPSTALLVEEPWVEKAMVLSLQSLIDLIGLSAGTYQNKSAAPVVSLATMRSGSPLGEGSHGAERAPGHAEIGAVRQHHLERLAGALRVENVGRDAVLGPDAGAHAHLGDGRVPIAFLPDGEGEVLGRCWQCGERPAWPARKREQGATSSPSIPRLFATF